MSSLPTPVEEFQEHGVQRTLSGMALKVLIAVALTFSTYQLNVKIDQGVFATD